MTTIEKMRTDAEKWIDENWNHEITVAEWWQRLASAGLSSPTLNEPWGRGWTSPQALAFAGAMAERGVLGPPAGIGMMLAAPTILSHGTPDLIDRFVPDILNGQHGWCQLFSEPGAGSDLAGIQTRAERDGDEWMVNGQKVWTSGGQWADYGILVARSNPELPKHQGITYFGFPMRQAGVEVRPLREMTGRAIFNEVFLTDARVAHENVIGEVNGGWKVANTTLMFERAGIGSASSGSFGAAIAGTVAGHLDQPANLFVRGRTEMGVGGGVGHKRLWQLVDLARKLNRDHDARVRQDLARLHTLIEITSWHMGRMRDGSAHTGGEGNMAKIRNSQMTALARDVGNTILGMRATLTGSDSESGGDIQELTVFSPAPSIYGGTDQIQRNIIGERVLGLPKEPGPGRDTPFNQLEHNYTR